MSAKVIASNYICGPQTVEAKHETDHFQWKQKTFHALQLKSSQSTMSTMMMWWFVMKNMLFILHKCNMTLSSKGFEKIEWLWWSQPTTLRRKKHLVVVFKLMIFMKKKKLMRTSNRPGDDPWAVPVVLYIVWSGVSFITIAIVDYH